MSRRIRTRANLIGLLCFVPLLMVGETAWALEVGEDLSKTGWGVRVRISFAPGWERVSYEGPPMEMTGSRPPGFQAPPSGDLDLATSALALNSELGLGVGFWDDQGSRFGVDVSALAGGVVAGGDGLPHTEVSGIALVTLGPSYSRQVSPGFEWDLSLRAAVSAFSGGKYDVWAHDNVIEFGPHWGGWGRLGAVYLLDEEGRFGLNVSVQGGVQFAGDQSTALTVATVGFQWE